ncbi:unnamed protein product [Cuscuta europaea]|uniref:Uncharacterized protein n=1 Tax=Cuscuta europaea TaxID=41803 RepID=A0A9P0Z2L5_CUSEU|nr:unnamed protein product [Cuscuta europaea]
MLRFYLDLYSVLVVLCFSSKKTLELRSGDEESGLQVIGSVKSKAGSANYFSFTEVINSNFGSEADDRHKKFCHFVTCLSSVKKTCIILDLVFQYLILVWKE